MTMSYKDLTQSSNTSTQHQLVITFNVGPELGPNCLKDLPADYNFIFKKSMA